MWIRQASMKRIIPGKALAVMILVVLVSALMARPVPARAAVAVTLDNYVRAQTDLHFRRYAEDGYFGTLRHEREPQPVEGRMVRPNRDVLYSIGLFDLAHPVRFVTPERATRMQSMQVINQDHYTPIMSYGGIEQELTQEDVGSRYALVVFRTQVDADDPEDIDDANAMQDEIKWHQEASGSLELPDWDAQQMTALREAILDLSPWISGSHDMFGAKDEVDPVRHLWGTAAAWLGQPESAAFFMTFTPLHNESDRAQVLTVPFDVPITAFWSVTVYDKEGRLLSDAEGAWSLQSSNAHANEDGSVTLLFGGSVEAHNYLAIEPGWSYTFRFYRPAGALLDGDWVPPSPIPLEVPEE